MTHPDLLTDEDLATRHEKVRGYFNQFMCIAIEEDSDILCSTCERTLASAIGQIFFSCCPTSYPTEAEAKANCFEVDSVTGEHIADYMGTFEL